MPDLNDSSKEERGFPLGRNSMQGTGKGLVTFGARKGHEGLPFLMELVEQ
jgi:hypothetical protein